jgi:oxygen-independent coproporphyrinogen-3 oxidase
MENPFKPLTLTSNCSSDRAVLNDLLRCYGYEVRSEEAQAAEACGMTSEAQLTSNDIMDVQAKDVMDMAVVHEMGVCVPTALARPPLLQIAWDRQKKSVRLNWQDQQQTCSWEEEVRPFAFEETWEYRRRRVLRLAFHHMLIAYKLARPNPWGILTGVRPTKMIHRFLDQGLSEEDIRHILEVEYGVEKTRIGLLLQTVQYQRPILSKYSGDRKVISLYLGFPFCPSRCSYCSFPGYDLKRWKKWAEPCFQAMLEEIHQIGAAAGKLGLKIQTMYFGGGTPTSMDADHMDKILSALSADFDFMPDAEWTVEGGRPETLTEEILDVLSRHKVHRICVNPQTMQQKTLDSIGRKHRVEDVEETFRRLAGRNMAVNSDLILGLPGEGLAELKDTLDRLLAFRPENVTIHGLAIKRGSAFKENYPELLAGAAGQAMGDSARQKLTEAGYVPYYLYRQKEILAMTENIGYTLPEQHCLYNILMMEERQTIVGIGVGAASKFISPNDWSLENFYNPKDLIQYIERIDELIQRKVDKLKQIV